MNEGNGEPLLHLDRRQEALHIGVLAAALSLIPIFALLLRTVVGTLISLWFPAAVETVYCRWALGSLPIYFAGMPAAWWLLRSLPARAPARRRWDARLMAGALVGIVGVSYLVAKLWKGIGTLFSELPSRVTVSGVNTLAEETPLWFLLVFSVVLAPLFEEWMYRRLLVDRLSRYGVLPTVLMSGVTFAFSHGNLTQVITSFAAGVILAFVYLYTGRLSCTVGLHAAFNLLCGVLPTAIMRLQGDAHTMVSFVHVGLVWLSIFSILPLSILFAGDWKRREKGFLSAVGRMSARDWVHVTLGNVGVWFYLAVITLLLFS